MARAISRAVRHQGEQASLLLPVAVAIGNFMTGLDQYVVITALPAMGRSLGEAPAAMGLTLTAYLAALIIGLPAGGWASDRFGARTVYVWAALTFTAASLLCGLADAFWQLVAARMLQGLGGAMMGTVGQVVILGSFPRHRTLRINTYVSLATQVAPMVGPVLGGMLTTYVSWRWIFLVNLPVGIFVTGMVNRLFPTGRRSQSEPFDLPGFVLVGAGVTLLVFGMDGVAATAPPAGASVELAAAAVLLVLAGRHFLRVPFPLLDPGLLRLRTFRISLVTGGGLDTISLTAVMFVLPLMLQEAFGMTAAASGSLTFLAAVGSVSVRLLLPPALRRFGFRRILVTNTPLLAATIAVFTLFRSSTPAWLIGSLIFVFGLCRSIQWGSTGNLAYAEVGPDQLARFSTLYYVLWQFAVAVSVGTAAALVALIQGMTSHADPFAFRIVLLLEAAVTLLALIAYWRLRPGDGQAVSGHADPEAVAEQLV